MGSLEGVVAVRDRFSYPGTGRTSLPPEVWDDGPGIRGRNALPAARANDHDEVGVTYVPQAYPA